MMAGQSRSSGQAVEHSDGGLDVAASGVGLKRVGPGSAIIRTAREAAAFTRLVRQPGQCCVPAG